MLGSSTHRVLLTFDDGPDPAHTARLLDVLARRRLHAIFFVLGEKLESPEYRAVIERAAVEGHLIGSHGYSHRRLTALSDDEIRAEFDRTAALMGGLSGSLSGGVKLWRPPFGDRDARVDAVLVSLGYTRMLWNVDSLDWRPDASRWADQTIAQIGRRMSRGFRNSVCLFHDTSPATAERFDDFLDRVDELPGVRVGCYLSLAEQDKAPGIVPRDAVSFSFDDACVVARGRVNALYVLNPTASVLWEILADGASEAEAARELARQFGIADDVARHDVQSALADWRTRGLLGPAPPELEDAGPWPRAMNESVAARAPGEFAEEREYRFLDLHFLIRYQTAGLARTIHARFANLETTPAIAPESVFQVFIDDGDCVLNLPDGMATRHTSAPALAYALFFEIMKLAHPKLQPMAWLHASLMGHMDSSFALVGNSGSGKSTLAAALGASATRPGVALSPVLPGEAGRSCSVLSDDRVFLDSVTGRPAASPNAIGLKHGSWQPLRTRYGDILERPLVDDGVRFLLPPPAAERLLPPVTHVFFPAYRASGATIARPLAAVQALERITAAEGWISSDQQKITSFLQWMEPVHFYDLPFSNLDAAIQQIEERLKE